MTNAPERIFVAPPYHTISGKVPDIVWKASWDGAAQPFKDAQTGSVEYIHIDKYKALVKRVQKLENVDYDMLIDLLSETMAGQINGHIFINEHATEIVEVLKPYLSTKIIHNTKMESI